MNLTQPTICTIINQIFEVEKKIKDQPLEKSLSRNLRRIQMELETLGYTAHNPLGESYNPTRLDCEAMTSGTAGIDQLKIVEVIKPIIYQKVEDRNTILQKAVVMIDNQ